MRAGGDLRAAGDARAGGDLRAAGQVRAPGAVRAAGVALWRPGPSGREVAVVHRPRYDDWSLPKGKLDPGEHPAAAAVREAREETGVQAVLGSRLGTSRYPVLAHGQVVGKSVQWWSARAVGGTFRPGPEVDDLRWLPVEQARALLTAGRDAAVLDALAATPQDAATVLLVRHALAGRRADWSGPDAARPLDEVGRATAHALRELLALWEPVRLVSAPPLRCTSTLAPLAARLRLPVEVDPRYADGADPAQARAALVALAAPDRPLVVCSQGALLPALLALLAQEAGRALDPRTAKGEGWVLTLDGRRLVAADRLSVAG